MKIFLALLLLLVSKKTATAYIDPGTTGMIIGGGLSSFLMVPLVFLAGLFMKFAFRPFKKLVLKICLKLKSIIQKK